MELTLLNGDILKEESLQGKVVLYVNVASRCGLTPQYKELQSLYEEKQNDGFVIIGVPCNQFGRQEPGTAEEIQQFCDINYNVTFPLLSKQDVNGANRSPLYQKLIQEGSDITWNFEKFLVGKNGNVLKRFSPATSPADSKLRSEIDTALNS